jgi:hypothetical protein
MTFTEEPSHVSLTTPYEPTNQNYMLQRLSWAHVALTVSFDNVSDVKFYLNGGLIQDCPDVVLFVADNPNLNHYVGGIRHNWQLSDAFEGFIYSFSASNYVKTDFSTGFWSDSACTEDCGICFNETTCLSDCEFYEKVVEGACVSCSGTNECNTCGDNCFSCDDFDSEDCTVEVAP